MYGHPTRLCCQGCDATFPVPGEWRFHYTSGRTPAETAQEWVAANAPEQMRPILGDLVWCHACNAPSSIERVPSASEFEMVARILRSPGGARFDGLGDRQEFDVDTRLLDLAQGMGLEVLGDYAARLLNRTSRRRCLACGSSSFTPIVLRANRVVSLKHEACGGDLRAEWIFVGAGISRRMPFQAYTKPFFGWDGEFKWAIRFLSETDDGQVEWIQDHVTRNP